MYKNIIKFKSTRVALFLTSEEVFSPCNPTYSKLQKILVEMDFKQECNHRFGDLLFTYEEIEYYKPIIRECYELSYIAYNFSLLNEKERLLIDNLVDLFRYNIKPEDIDKVSYNEFFKGCF